MLTSTIQDIPKLYEQIATAFDEGELQPGTQSCGIKEGTIYLGNFSPSIDYDIVESIQKDLNHYKKTGKLPNEK